VLPVTSTLSAHVHKDEAVISDPLKDIYKRPRPYNYDSSLHSRMQDGQEPSYPSGHSLSGYLLAFIMAQIVPEKRQEILATVYLKYSISPSDEYQSNHKWDKQTFVTERVNPNRWRRVGT
jgi:hypothetical protein